MRRRQSSRACTGGVLLAPSRTRTSVHSPLRRRCFCSSSRRHGVCARCATLIQRYPARVVAEAPRWGLLTDSAASSARHAPSATARVASVSVPVTGAERLRGRRGGPRAHVGSSPHGLWATAQRLPSLRHAALYLPAWAPPSAPQLEPRAPAERPLSDTRCGKRAASDDHGSDDRAAQASPRMPTWRLRASAHTASRALWRTST